MSDRQALIAKLRVLSSWIRDGICLPPAAEKAIDDAATALEEAQGVPREPTPLEQAVAQNRRVLGLPPQRHAAAPAAPTREPVSAATPRDEQDARRLDWLERRHVEVWDTDEQGQPYRKLMAAGADKSALRYLVDAALAEPKR